MISDHHDGKQPVDLQKNSETTELFHNLSAYRIAIDAAYDDSIKDRIFAGTNSVSIVSGNYRRKVYAINSDAGNFYLKFSPLSRHKDRLRFYLLPWRIATEWRNLARLSQKGIHAAKRVLFGYNGRYPNHGFFLVTKAVTGVPINPEKPEQIRKLAACLASLHAAGVFHRDMHPGNVLLDHNHSPALLDAQEVYFLPWMPRRIRVSNLGNMWWHIQANSRVPIELEDFLAAYNSGADSALRADEIIKTMNRRQQRHFRSRSRRCCKNSSVFQVITNERGLKGFRRRDFSWGRTDLQAAMAQGTYIKDKKLIAHKDVCIKIFHKRFLHKNRSLASWKMSRALDVRGIAVPRALSYFVMDGKACFLSRFYENSMALNDYFSKGLRDMDKTGAMRTFAEWLRAIHDQNIWQRDFKSSNVLVLDHRFMMVDLDGVKITRGLSRHKKLINLAQLNASIGDHLTLKDRLRFFHFYCRKELLPRKTRRRAYQTIWKITQQKNTSPFGLDPEKLRPRVLNPSTKKY